MGDDGQYNCTVCVHILCCQSLCRHVDVIVCLFGYLFVCLLFVYVFIYCVFIFSCFVLPHRYHGQPCGSDEVSIAEHIVAWQEIAYDYDYDCDFMVITIMSLTMMGCVVFPDVLHTACTVLLCLSPHASSWCTHRGSEMIRKSFIYLLSSVICLSVCLSSFSPRSFCLSACPVLFRSCCSIILHSFFSSSFIHPISLFSV